MESRNGTVGVLAYPFVTGSKGSVNFLMSDIHQGVSFGVNYV